MYNTGGEPALQKQPGKPIIKNRVGAAIKAAVLKMAFDHPSFAKSPASNELRKLIHFTRWRSQCVAQASTGGFYKPLAALEAHVAEEGIILPT